MRHLAGDAGKIAVIVLALAGFLWLIGWHLSPALAVVGFLAALLLRWADLAVPAEEVVWPSPDDVLPSAVMGSDAWVRRTSWLVEAGSVRGSVELAEVLHDELCRRLVARHGADPSDPLHTSRTEVSRRLMRAATRPVRLDEAQLDELLDELEDL